jgi:type I restriction enzyme S subunit
MSWRTSRLGDVLTLKRGHDLPNHLRNEGEIPVVSSSGITGYHNEAKAKPPGVVTGRYGTLGEVFYLDKDYWPLNTSLYVVDFKNTLPKFAFYFLKNALGNYQSDKAAVPGIDRNVLHELMVSIPDIDSQASIAAFLSTYDDLLDNNRRRMALLEDAVAHLYREWFLCFRFPGHEHTQIVNGTPDGWQRQPLSNLTSFLKRGITPHYDEEASGLVINQKCIRSRRLSLDFARHQSREFKPEKQVQVGDVLVNSTGEGTLGRVAQVKTPVPNCTVDTHVTIVRPALHVPQHYFGSAVMDWETRFAVMGKGATNQTELSPRAIGEIEVMIPAHALVTQFELFAEPLYTQMVNLAAQNEKLRAVQSLLLPRLMSGEIKL